MTGSIGSIVGDAPSEVDKIFTEDDMPDVEKLSFRTKCGLEVCHTFPFSFPFLHNFERKTSVDAVYFVRLVKHHVLTIFY